MIKMMTSYGEKASLFISKNKDLQRVEALGKLNARFVLGSYWDSYNLTVILNFSFLAVPDSFFRGKRFLSLFVRADTVFLLDSIHENATNRLKKLYSIKETEYPFVFEAVRRRSVR